MLKLSDARNFGRTLTGLLLIVGPLLLVIAQIVTPDTTNDDKARELANVAAHKGAVAGGSVAFLVGSVCMLGAAIGVIHLFRGRRVGLGQVAGALLVLGGCAPVAFYAFTALEYEMATGSGLDRAQMARLLHDANSTSLMIPIFFMFLAGIVLGLLLLAIAAWRSGIVPRWGAVAIGLAGPLSFASQGKALEILSFAVLAVGLGSLGWAALRMSDEEWDAPRGAVAAAAAPLAAAEPAPAV